MTILPQPADNGSNREVQQHVASVLRTLLDYPLPALSWEMRDAQHLRVKFGQSQLIGYVVSYRDGGQRSDEEMANCLAQWAEFFDTPIRRSGALFSGGQIPWEISTTFNDVNVRIWASIGVEHDARCFPAEAAAEAAIRKAQGVETPREPEPDSDSGSGAGERLEHAVEQVRPQITGPGTMLAADAPAIYAEMLKATICAGCKETGWPLGQDGFCENCHGMAVRDGLVPDDEDIERLAAAEEDRIASAAGR